MCENCNAFTFQMYCDGCWKELTKPKPFVCCAQKMRIEDDTSAQCYECGRVIFNAVPCATKEQYYANGGRRRTPYKRIKYFREWMSYILGYPVYVDEDTMERIRNDLPAAVSARSLKRTLKRLKLQKYNKGISCLLSEITQTPIPDVSADTMQRAEWLFGRITKKIYYYPDVIYEIFYEINPRHPLLPWIPRR